MKSVVKVCSDLRQERRPRKRWAVLFVTAVGAVGCSSNNTGTPPTTQPATASQRAERAQRDPFHYSPDFSETNIGGETGSFDRKGFQRDVEHVIMP